MSATPFPLPICKSYLTCASAHKKKKRKKQLERVSKMVSHMKCISASCYHPHNSKVRLQSLTRNIFGFEIRIDGNSASSTRHVTRSCHMKRKNNNSKRVSKRVGHMNVYTASNFTLLRTSHCLCSPCLCHSPSLYLIAHCWTRALSV